MTNEQKMKLIYVSHPYGGDPVEAADADNRIKALAEKYPQFVFISPIHAIRRDYHATNWEEGIAACISLEARCDAVLFLDGVQKKWENSLGCLREYDFAMKHEDLGILSSDDEMLLWSLVERM
jgi:hypothetical protein